MLSLPAILFGLALALFTGLEIWVNVRDRGRVDASKDADSLRTIGRLRNAAFLIAIISTFFPVVPLPGGRGNLFLLGAALVLAGLFLRTWAVGKLGEYFTGVVMTHENQRLVTDGLYRYVRHPAYAGALLFFAGLATATGSLPGLCLIGTMMVYAFRKRIEVEEKVMISLFGQEYIDYMKRTKRVIPLLY